MECEVRLASCLSREREHPLFPAGNLVYSDQTVRSDTVDERRDREQRRFHSRLIRADVELDWDQSSLGTVDLDSNPRCDSHVRLLSRPLFDTPRFLGCDARHSVILW